ncbi:DNA-binding transcriptional regulator, AcrR family [Sinosporangium album]|uniref:DNA-binding transcriptional regulator, AcrR family n=1 Tax=Sinosporangium album TaxID=504805 RepID=A0A1G7RSP0_9ACTN|nr:TetR/AcrR family transcriptional regulator [Sinosporangium album]SDG13847.1 DNA-binding transcriptional regulator, AcrR family [Sinosporangium album]
MATLDQGNDTRSRILAAARALFAERGYAGTSLADIGAAVGLTKTAVAYHFHPKDRLAAEIIAPAAEDMLVLLGTDFAGDRAAYLDAFITFVVRHRAVIRLIIDDLVDDLLGDLGGADEVLPGTLGEAIRTFRDEIFNRLLGPDPTPADRALAWTVLGGVQTAIVKTMDMPEEEVRDILRVAAAAVMESRPR